MASKAKKEKIKVAVIDDDIGFAKSILNFLEDYDYEAIIETSGLGGINAIKTENPDIALLDLNLPDIDGLEALKQIKQFKPELPVIIISGATDLKAAINAVKSGASDYIAKPIFDLEELLICIKNTMTRFYLESELTEYRKNLEKLVKERTSELYDKTNELEKTNEILKKEIKKREQTEISLRESIGLFQALGDATSSMILILDKDSNVKYANKNTCEVLNCHEQDILYRDIKLFLPVANEMKLNHIRKSEKIPLVFPREYELDIVSSNGGKKWIHIIINDINFNRETHRLITGYDITERKIAEDRQKEGGRRIIDALENERRRLARELHDSIGQKLMFTKINLELAVKPENADKQKIAEVIENLQSIAQEISLLTKSLYPPAIEKYKLTENIISLVKSFENSTKIRTEIVFNGEEPALNKKIKLNIFRVVQEALNNISKHSQAENVEIKFNLLNDKITCSIKDDGRGLGHKGNEEELYSGSGLFSMQERILQLKGNLSYFSPEGKGLEICFEAPL
jgi:PAS domain S-box-containing protein